MITSHNYDIRSKKLRPNFRDILHIIDSSTFEEAQLINS